MKKYLIVLPVIFLYAIIFADIVYLESGGFVEGKIVEEDDDRIVIESKIGGRVELRKERIARIDRGTNEEIFKKRLEELKPDDIEGHFELGLWAKHMGLINKAKERFRYVLEKFPDHEFARAEMGYRKLQGKWVSEEEYYTAQGYVQYEGEWVKKEDAEKMRAGFVQWGDEWVKKEDLEKIKAGYRRLGDKWVTEEEYYKAKGYVQYEGRWMPPEKAEKMKQAAEERKKQLELLKLKNQIKGSIKLKCSFAEDAEERHLQRFGEMVKKAAKIIWDMTGGGIWLEEAEIYDKAKDGDCVVLNNDGNTVPGPGGRTVYGYASGGKFYVGGNCYIATFVHEFGHAKFGLPDHYGTQIVCIMNAGEGAKYMKYIFCDGCWDKVNKRYQGQLKRPSKEDEDFGEPPETKVIISNR
ncbi:MAG: hypothetical protein N2234_08475 [Planctomycetota bacterium]|nr:hypothetical protein [Planctomycetota bacterium]